jgi:triacylglycerol lipase
LYIVFRGTKTQSEWVKDLQTNQDPINSLQSLWSVDDPTVLVHSGFLSIFKEFSLRILSVIQSINPQHMYITGHSLGAAIATLAGLQYSYLNIPLVVYAFASPLVGNQAFANVVDSQYVLHRITNNDDLITMVPLNVMFNLNGDHFPYYYAKAGIDHAFSKNYGSWTNNHLLPIYINFLQE